MIDHSLQMRRAMVAKLRADAPLLALVPAARIFGEETPSSPVWPFIRYGFSPVTTFETSCGRGSEHDIVLHVFALGPGTDETAEICAAVVAALSDSALPIDPIQLQSLDWVRTEIIRDTDEASAYHGILTFTAQTLES